MARNRNTEPDSYQKNPAVLRPRTLGSQQNMRMIHSEQGRVDTRHIGNPDHARATAELVRLMERDERAAKKAKR